MSNNLLISYDLMSPGQNYETVIKEIKKLGGWAQVHYSLWYVRSDLSAVEARDRVKTVMDDNDKLFVADMKAAAWRMLDDDVSKYINEHWNAPARAATN